MTERWAEHKLVTEAFGREETPANLTRKAAASIYHSIFLHNRISNEQLLIGIRKNLRKLISSEDLLKFEKNT